MRTGHVIATAFQFFYQFFVFGNLKKIVNVFFYIYFSFYVYSLVDNYFPAFPLHCQPPFST